MIATLHFSWITLMVGMASQPSLEEDLLLKVFFLMSVVGSWWRLGVGIEGRKLTEEMAEERH